MFACGVPVSFIGQLCSHKTRLATSADYLASKLLLGRLLVSKLLLSKLMHGKFWPNKLLNIGVAAILIAASTGALAGNVANAQIPGVQTGKIETPLIEELIVYGSRTQTAASALPGSAYKIGTEDLALTRHRHIADSLVRVPGVWLSRGNGQEHLTALRSPVLTGAGACGAFLMAEDNIPLRAAGFCNVNQLFEATSELAGRIEVLSGPQSVLYGSNALHGVINVVSLPYQVTFRCSGPDQPRER